MSYPAKDKWFAFALILFVLGILWARQPVPALNDFDQPFYLGIAHDILHEGKFTDGFAFNRTPGARPSGMRFAPVYPALVATIAVYDSAFARSIDCVVDTGGNDKACADTAMPIRLLQFGLLATIYLLWWHCAGIVSGSRLVGWLSLIVALIAAPELARGATYVMTETVCLFFTTAAIAAMLAAFKAEKPCACAALSGVMLGLAILTRPAFLYLGLAAIIFGWLIVLLPLPHGRGRDQFRKEREGEGVGSLDISTLTRPAKPVDLSREGEVKKIVLQFSIAVALTLTPWLIRNVLVMHQIGLTAGYAAHTLIQRVAFDLMSWSEVLNSFLCWLPDGKSWLGPQECSPFSWDSPDSYYRLGNGAFMSAVLDQAGGWPHVMPYLLRHDILAEPLKHAAVTLSLATRGAWISNDWGFVCCDAFLWQTILALRRRRADFLLVALPGLFMLFFNAAVSVNQPRYNLMLIQPYALSGALLLQAIGRKLKVFRA